MALKKQERQALILDILAREVVDSQEGLMHHLPKQRSQLRALNL